EGEAGAGPGDDRPFAAALRHPRKGRRVVEVGGGREAAPHGPRAQREAAGRWSDARQHRRIIGQRTAWVREGREQRELRSRRLRTRGAGDQGRTAVESELAEAGDRALPRL